MIQRRWPRPLSRHWLCLKKRDENGSVNAGTRISYDAKHWARSFIDNLMSSAAKDALTAKGDIKEVRELVGRVLAGGKRIALFLDYDGTLREIERQPAAKPTRARGVAA